MINYSYWCSLFIGLHMLLSTLCVIHVDYLTLFKTIVVCVTNAVSFVVFCLLHSKPLTQLPVIGSCLLPHHVSDNLWPRGMRNFVLAVSMDFLHNFIEYKGEKREHMHMYTHKAKQMEHI
jgi:hypothetical protein